MHYASPRSHLVYASARNPMSDDSNANSTEPGQAWTQSALAMAEASRQWLLSLNLPGASAPPLSPATGGDANPLTELQRETWERHARLWQSVLGRKAGEAVKPVVAPASGDRRFSAAPWSESPVYDYLRQAYLINAEFMTRAADAVPVADGRAKDRLRYLTRQFVEAMAPSNFAATNPEFIQAALDSKGESIKAGIRNLIADLEKGRISMTEDAAFEVGRNLAVTPGSVIYQNELIQLIQYAPCTNQVALRPLLIVPPCINKYYILDLQAENSLVRHAVEQGNTVFLISWRNVQAGQGRLGWDDYLEMGPLAALRVMRAVCGVDQVNALGFCVGGTILSSALAVANARGDDPVASLTLLTTLLDISDAGEIGSLVDESLVMAKEATVGKGGLMPGRELANIFSSLRGNDLIWQYVVGNYLKGSTPPPFDLLYWNCDATNLPGPFLAWYLRNLYLENSLRVPGKLSMCGTRVDLGRLGMPAFVYASREDHIVPWRTAYLSRGLLGGETTFVLGASGHIAGVINPPAKNKRSHWVADSAASSADEWLAAANEVKGSWWPRWSVWLARYAGGETAARRQLGSAEFPVREDAPGSYVKESA
jgi:polyhydroxyalkanoate synthase